MKKILIGNQIRRFRREKGFTQAQLAELAHISEKTLSDIENDKINPRYKSIINISRALEVPIGVLSTEIETCGKDEFIDYLSDYQVIHNLFLQASPAIRCKNESRGGLQSPCVSF